MNIEHKLFSKGIATIYHAALSVKINVGSSLQTQVQTQFLSFGTHSQVLL
jgi:hypothetical protein